MKHLLIAVFCLIAIPFCVRAQTKSLPSNYTEVVGKWIGEDNARTKPKRAPYAEIDGDSIPIYVADLDLDGDDDCLALYNVSYGGNAVTQYMAVFINKNGKLSKGYKNETGGTGQSMIDSITFQNGVIVCSTTVWKEDDAQCCPSGKGTLKYVFRKGKIKRA